MWAASIVGNLALPILLVLLFGGERGPIGSFAVIASVVAVAAVVRWTRFWYRVDRDAIVMRGGLLRRWERTIQRSRIQSVDVVQKLSHRAFAVVELRIEVVGGEQTEGSLVALEPREADALRGLLIADRPPEVDRRTPPLVRMRPKDLLVAGVTGGRVAVMAAIVGWATQLLPEERFVRTLDRLAGADRSDLETFLVLGAALVIASIAISLVTTVVVYWGFTAERHGDRLVISRGLLQTRRSVVPLARIQAIRLEENLLRRAFGLASLRVVTAGYGRSSGDEHQTSMLAPVATRERCASIAATVLDAGDLATFPLRPASRSALWLRLARAVTAAAVVAVASWAAARDARWLAIALPLALAFLLLAVLSWHALAHGIRDDHVVVRWGALLRRTAVAKARNVQHVVLRRSPIQRLFGVASVTLAIPKGPASMVDLDEAVAEERFDELASRLVRADGGQRRS